MKKLFSNPFVSTTLGVISIALITSIFFYFTKSKNTNSQISNNPSFDYSLYVSEHTSGEISKVAPIVFRFASKRIEDTEVNTTLKSAFDFTPSIDGEATWLDNRTLIFKPSEFLSSDQKYDCNIELDDFIDDIPDTLENYNFSFKTKKQDFNVKTNNLEIINPNSIKWYRITNSISLNDYESPSVIKSIISTTIDKKEQNLRWNFDSISNTHTFTLDSIERKDTKQDLRIEWDGKPIDVAFKSHRSFKINALGDFSLIDIKTQNNPDQLIQIFFSDPLLPKQNLNNLISLGKHKFTYIINGNTLNIYPKERILGSVKFNIKKGILNAEKYPYSNVISRTLTFEDIKPEVRLVNKKTITPTTKGKIPFIFESVNLNAVDIRVIKIYEKNIIQFLQVNELNTSQELKRVGQVVFADKVTLKKSTNLHAWNKHSIDLANLISPEPGAIYQVAIGFRHSYSLYGCNEEDEVKDYDMLALYNWSQPSGRNRDYYYDYYDYYDDYDYSDRKNPCTSSYYGDSKVKTQNILASNIGLIFKKNNNNEILVAANDINTTSPLTGISIEVYDYQQQLIFSGKTDGSGMMKTTLSSSPFLIIAKKGKTRGYLKVNDGNALSLSNFEVGGVRKFHGLNGFIYGERGVWRPGDSLNLSLIIEDEKNTLPNNHPITFKFINPNGQTLIEQTITTHLGGIYTFKPSTAEDAITGTYQVVAHVGGTTFRKSLPIETILPNRLRIKTNLKEGQLITNTTPIELSSEWLHGAKASNLKADVMLSLSSLTTKFKNYKSFNFDNPVSRFEGDNIKVFEGKLDENGKTNFKIKFDDFENIPGTVKTSFKTKVYEPSGNFSIDQFNAKYMAYDNYIGLQLHTPKNGYLTTDTSNWVNLVSLNRDGKIAPNRKINVKVYKLGYKWWYDEGYDRVSYNSVRYKTPITNTYITTNSNGKGKFSLRVNYPAWGRYLVVATDENGHSTGKIAFLDWPSWYNKSEREMPNSPNVLAFTTDKKDYTSGENVTINFPSSKGSRALVTVENSEKVLHAEWVATTDKNTSYTFKASNAMAPNAYVHVTLVQPHEKTNDDVPMRLYGIQPIKVVNPTTKLSPQIKTANIIRPNSTTSIEVSEENGKSMNYTIAIVDEGLLDITRFKTPNPWEHFYKKEALGIKTWDLFDNIISFANLKTKSMITIGGDGSLSGDSEGSKQNRFKPLVKFLGPFHLPANQKKSHKIKIPNYVGSVRTMVIAEKASAYGHAEKATPVREDLMVLGTLPRVLGIGETIDVPVTVFAMDKKITNVKVVAKSGNKSIKLNQSKSINFSQTGEQTIVFSAKVSDITGTGNVKIIATSGSEKAIYNTDIEIRNPNLPVTNTYSLDVNPKKKNFIDFTPVGINGTNNVTVEVSTVPPINLEKRLNYLIRYPYGCIEQTTSSVFPQVYLPKLISLDSKKQADVEKNIKDGINRLKAFQISNGGFSYWPGQHTANPWGTNYAGHFLIEAKKAGYSIPSNMLENWTSYQKDQALAYSNTDYKYRIKAQAYRLYLLAKVGEPQLGAMNRLRLARNVPLVAKWYLATAYALAGQPHVGKEMGISLGTSINPYTELSGSYGTSLRDDAVLLECMSTLGLSTKAKQKAIAIGLQLSDNKWLSTQTTAYSLVAIANYIGVNDVRQETAFSINIDGVSKSFKSKSPIQQYKQEVKGIGNQKIEIKNSSSKTLFVKVIQEGIPPIGEETTASNGITLNIQYKSLKEKVLDPANIPQGTDFYAYINIKNIGAYDYKEVALNQVFPSGWQIHNDRLHSSSSSSFDKPTYQDIRDDRVYTFFNISKGSSKRFRILLNATYKGTYYLPTTQVEAMYDKSISARVKGQWITIE